MKLTYEVRDLGAEGVSVLSENEDSQSLFYSITTSCFLTVVGFNREFYIRTQTAYKEKSQN